MRAGLTEASFPFISGLGVAARRDLGALTISRAKAKQQLLRRGDATDGAYLVTAGSLRVYYLTSEGREATLYHVQPGGACILSLAAALRAEPYPAWVDAGPSGSSQVRVPSATLRRFLAEEAAFRDFVFGALSGRVFELMQAIEETGSAGLEQRVARYLTRHVASDGSVRATQAAIASELGTAREVVFRALRSLSERGLLKTGRMRVQVTDLRALRAFAGLPTP
jgi:CRP/FNR family transcriptional regulator